MNVFNLPDLGEGLPDAGIVTWHVKIGDSVTVDQLLVSVETAKAIVDLPSPYTGVIEKLCAAPGEILNVGQPLVIFKEEQNKDKNKDDKNKDLEILAGTAKATPAVRALAKKLNIDLYSIKPTGPNNTITLEDVEKMVVHNGDSKQSLDWQIVDHTARSMAIAMQQSVAEVVPATIFEDLILPDSVNIDLTVNLMQAIAFAQTKEPALNAWFKKEQNNFKQKLFSDVNLGIAVDSKDGLFVPVIKNVAAKTADNLRKELDLLCKKIEKRMILLEQLQQPTFILSNFGKFAGRYATPVILPPTVAILAVGKLRQTMVVLHNAAAIRNVVPVSLTFDHRAVTGGQAARFLMAILKFFSKTKD